MTYAIVWFIQPLEDIHIGGAKMLGFPGEAPASGSHTAFFDRYKTKVNKQKPNKQPNNTK